MRQSPLILHALTFRWPESENPLFAGLSEEFAPGTVSAVMGANGSGKTTLLEVVAGRMLAETGKVLLGDMPANSDDFNYLPQDSARLLFPHLTLADNIALQRMTTNGSIPTLVNDLFLDDTALTRYPAHCSGGQRQRAAVCRAVLDMPSFPVTLLDESFSHLSRDAKATVGAAIQNTARESGAIVVFVTHDLLDAMRLGDRVLALASGKTAIFDTSDIQSEADCWRETARREAILRSLLLSGAQIV
jgi:ABC-type nitrate/sulfonate/bicarbonate transport system ATPase subunit